jgi:gamma-glutamylcyclotransferase (GGCT)/AIG2-like uncharacterized protein YtfP
VEWVFVYGSLRPGASNYSIVRPYVKEVYSAYIQGELYLLPTGYPTVIYAAGGKVYGELLRVEPFAKVVALLDEFEDYYGSGVPHNEYQRIEGIVWRDTGQQYLAYLYACPDEKINQCRNMGIAIPSGDWQAFQREKEKSR